MRLIVFFLLAIASSSRAQDVPTGRWEGSVQIPGRVLRIVLDLDRNDAGFSGAVSLPDLGLRAVALTELAVNGGELSCSIKGALANERNGPARLKAQLKDDGTLAGEFAQGGHTAAMTATKTGPAQIEPARKSTSIAKELEGEWKGGYELFGYPRKVTLKLQNRGAESAGADFVILGKKENILPVDLVIQEGSFVSVISSETGLSFEGQFDRGQLKGAVLQGPLEIPVTLQRAK